jgi:hypothetical protein
MGERKDEKKVKAGLARSAKLSPDRKKEIATNAAKARWNTPRTDGVLRATHEAMVKVGRLELPCAVLEDGTRVLTETKFMEVMGIYRSGALSSRRGEDEGGARQPLYLAFKNLQPHIAKHLGDVHSEPLKYITLAGNTAHGIRADAIPKICEVWLDARLAGGLGENQKKVAATAELILRGLAHVGIIALVDEATGYQYERARTALSDILAAFISKELAAWAKTFDDEFYREIFRLRGWDATDIRRRPGVVGRWTTDIVYARLAPGVRDELERVAPRHENGKLKVKLFQNLTNTGVQALLKHLGSVTTLMNVSDSWQAFIEALDRRHPSLNTTLLLPFLETEKKGSE